jgi:hypothetical protein
MLSGPGEQHYVGRHDIAESGVKHQKSNQIKD